MKNAIKKLLTEQQKQRIKAELAEIEAREAQSKLEPIEQPDDTFLIVNLKAKREELLAELARCEQILGEVTPVTA